MEKGIRVSVPKDNEDYMTKKNESPVKTISLGQDDFEVLLHALKTAIDSYIQHAKKPEIKVEEMKLSLGNVDIIREIRDKISKQTELEEKVESE